MDVPAVSDVPNAVVAVFDVVGRVVIDPGKASVPDAWPN